MPICNYKAFASLPENRNATLEPDAAGLLQLHTPMKAVFPENQGTIANHSQPPKGTNIPWEISSLKTIQRNWFPSLVSH